VDRQLQRDLAEHGCCVHGPAEWDNAAGSSAVFPDCPLPEDPGPPPAGRPQRPLEHPGRPVNADRPRGQQQFALLAKHPGLGIEHLADLAVEGVRVITPVTCVIVHDPYHRSAASPAPSRAPSPGPNVLCRKAPAPASAVAMSRPRAALTVADGWPAWR